MRIHSLVTKTEKIPNAKAIVLTKILRYFINEGQEHNCYENECVYIHKIPYKSFKGPIYRWEWNTVA